MNILFLHQNFPAQFRYLAPALAQAGHNVNALTMQSASSGVQAGVNIIPYKVNRGTSQSVHPWVANVETKVIRGEACFQAAQQLKLNGFTPDVIVAHPGWGESLFIKDVWPSARLGIYCEMFYQLSGADIGFDAEFPTDAQSTAGRLRLKNANNYLHFDIADKGLSPTKWQAGTFPESFRHKISVIHDGINTLDVCPNPQAAIRINDDTLLTRDNEVITFINRNLEPLRGMHVFMRTLPELLRKHPHAHVVIVGNERRGYGAEPDQAEFGKRSWRQIFTDEVSTLMPHDAWKRVHFVGSVPYASFVAILQVSRVHVYLSYPFILSWSLLEAMSAGCAVIASDVDPVREVVIDGENGLLVDFFDHNSLHAAITDLLSDPGKRQRLGSNARNAIVQKYDLQKQCLPQQLDWVQSLADL